MWERFNKSALTNMGDNTTVSGTEVAPSRLEIRTAEEFGFLALGYS